jgi:uncharacterized protein with PQ loop repeat
VQTVYAMLPLVAAFLAVPQFVPQLARVRRAGTAGVSWSWAALTSVNNAAWLGYFALSGFWTALVPAISATLLSGLLAVTLARRGGGMPRRPAVLVAGWAVVLLTAALAFGRTGLGSALAVAFALQVTPSVWTVFRSNDTAGVSRGTWLLIFGELLCWGVFGIHEGDPRLIVLGATGVVASLLVLAQVSWPRAGRSPLSTAVTGQTLQSLSFASAAPPREEPPCRTTTQGRGLTRCRSPTSPTCTSSPRPASRESWCWCSTWCRSGSRRTSPTRSSSASGSGR